MALPPGLGTVWGIHELHDPTDLSLWQVVKTRARFPNRGAPDARENSWGNAGKNATWQTKPPPSDPGVQIVVNATPSIPKTVTTFPDYFMYGAGGACAAQGYDPPGGWLCASYGGMHGGTFTPGQGWTGGYPTPFPASVELSNTSGVKQSVFPHSSKWDISGGRESDAKAQNGTRAKLRAWVNGWFTSMWEIADWCVLHEFSLCLSRACLGKMIVFKYKWLKNAVLHDIFDWVTIFLPRQARDKHRKK
jgi:hypothetical protein